MKIVIDIPDEVYKNVKDHNSFLPNCIHSSIETGTVLPKGYGRLVDTNALIMKLDEYNEYATFDCDAVKDLIDTAPAVIEADPGGNKCES